MIEHSADGDALRERILRRHVVQDVDGHWYMHSANGGTWSAHHLRLAADLLDELNLDALLDDDSE